MPFRPLSFTLLLAAVFCLVTGNGILSAVMPFRAKLEGFSDIVIGFIGSSYYAGMLGGGLVAPALVRLAGHRGGFAACSLAGALGALAASAVIEPFAWMGFRLAVGFSLAGLYAIVESWISQASTDGRRGLALGICSVVQYGAWSLGSTIFGLSDPRGLVLFALASGLLALSIPLLLLVRATPPGRPGRIAVDMMLVYRIAPAAFAAGLATGTANGPLFALTPVFGRETGLSQDAIGSMLAAFMLGSALFQVPNGWLSDRLDRQYLMAALALVATLSEAVLGVSAALLPAVALYGTALVVGAADAALYYGAVTLAIHRSGRENAVTIVSALVVLYGIGAIAGPPLASLVMTLAGPAALYLFQAAVHGALALFVAWQIWKAPRKLAVSIS